MTNHVTTIAELKKAIEEHDSHLFFGSELIALIDSFEASVKERIEELEKEIDTINVWADNAYDIFIDNPPKMDELRRILGVDAESQINQHGKQRS